MASAHALQVGGRKGGRAAHNDWCRQVVQLLDEAIIVRHVIVKRFVESVVPFVLQ